MQPFTHAMVELTEEMRARKRHPCDRDHSPSVIRLTSMLLEPSATDWKLNCLRPDALPDTPSPPDKALSSTDGILSPSSRFTFSNQRSPTACFEQAVFFRHRFEQPSSKKKTCFVMPIMSVFLNRWAENVIRRPNQGR